MELFVTEFAELELCKIFQCHFIRSPFLPKKFRLRFLKTLEEMIKNPDSGIEELSLNVLNRNYQYIVMDNFKLIFYTTDTTIFVTDILIAE